MTKYGKLMDDADVRRESAELQARAQARYSATLAAAKHIAYMRKQNRPLARVVRALRAAWGALPSRKKGP